MITAICLIVFLMVFFKLLGIAFKVGWGIFKTALFLVVFPVVALALIFGGLFVVAVPVIIVAGIAGIAMPAK